MTKSLSRFPTAAAGFDASNYGIDLRQQVAAKSNYTGDVGIEIELEGHNLPTGYTGAPVGGVTWVWHEDGSLRAPGGNARGGAEYVLSKPCAVSDVRPLVENLFTDIRRAGGRIQNSTRCSTHVHLNMRAVKLPQLAAFVALWGTFEDPLANFCGGHRSGNHFAMRFSDSHAAVTAWIEAFQTGNFAFSRERRYLALNPACLATFGSLEVRTAGGVDNADDVVEWVDMLTRLKAFALAVRDPGGLGADFSAYGVDGFATRVFGERIVADLRAACDDLGDSFDQLVMRGFRRVQPILHVLPWDVVSVECAKAYVPDPFGALKTKRKSAVADLDEAFEAAVERVRGAAPRIRINDEGIF